MVNSVSLAEYLMVPLGGAGDYGWLPVLHTARPMRMMARLRQRSPGSPSPIGKSLGRGILVSINHEKSVFRDMTFCVEVHPRGCMH